MSPAPSSLLRWHFNF